MFDQRAWIRFTAPVISVLLSTGCEGPSPTAPAEHMLNVQMSHGSSESPHTISIRGGAILTGQDFAPGFPGPKSDFGTRCSVPSDFVLRFTMNAHGSHLGRFTGEFEHCTQIDFQSGESNLTDGTAVLVTANGDELWLTYRSASEPVGEFDEAVTFVGGTGRFQRATGEALASAACDRQAGTCVYEAYGSIAYTASDRGGS